MLSGTTAKGRAPGSVIAKFTLLLGIARKACLMLRYLFFYFHYYLQLLLAVEKLLLFSFVVTLVQFSLAAGYFSNETKNGQKPGIPVFFSKLCSGMCPLCHLFH